MSLNKKHTQSKQTTNRNKQNTVDLGVKMQDVPILTFLQYVLYVWIWGALLQRGCQSLKMSYVHGESSARDSVFTEGRREAAPATHHGTFSTERQVPGVHAPDTITEFDALPPRHINESEHAQLHISLPAYTIKTMES